MVEPKGTTGRTTKTAAAAAKANTTRTAQTSRSDDYSSSSNNSTMDNIDNIDSDSISEKELLMILLSQVQGMRNEMRCDREALKNLVEQNTETRKQLEELESKVKLHENETLAKISALESELEHIKIMNKKNNIIIHGFQLPTGESNYSAFQQFMTKKLKGDPKKIYVNECIPLGRRDNPPLLVTLSSQMDKRYIFSLVKNLKGTQIFISDDLTMKQMKKRQKLLEHRKELLSNGAKEVRVYESSIRVDGEWFDLKNDGNVSKRIMRNNNPSTFHSKA
jgi:antitoxin component YwqK of YwqJK toxin-antitoxin module